MAGVDVAILSCSFRRVFDLLASPILKEFQSRYGYGDDEDLKKLRKKLWKLQTLLNDADQKQMRDNWVKEWLADVRDLVYDAVDIVDLYVTKVDRWNQTPNSSSHASSSSTNLYKLKKEFDIKSPLKLIIKKSEELVKLMHKLCLKADVEERPTTGIVRWERETTSLVDESLVFGRGDDMNKIFELLFSFEPGRVGVLPIVGMGGLGKTTLAQLVYNHQLVDRYFDLKAWVCVFEEVDVGRITSYIIESLTNKAPDSMGQDSLQVKLKDILMEKKFLVVLDGMWNENPNHWKDLQIPFNYGQHGSRIIVTTRSEVVSKNMGTIPAYSLGVLTNEDCWSLFRQCAILEDADLSANPKMETILKEIVTKCKGLPLAAKVLGSQLRLKVDKYNLEDIVTWGMTECENIILTILRLSYQHIPSHLMECFAYCSIFPKDYEFEKEELVLLWMAEGFLPSSGRKQMEDIGSIYLDDLFSRSFFQNRGKNGEPVFVMHDIIHDFAKSISREAYIAMDGDKLCNVSHKARHSSLVYVTRSQGVGFDAFHDAKRLSTFLLHFPSMLTQVYDIVEILHDLFPAWRCLRVLSLRNVPIAELPHSIGNLRLLRFLDLFGTSISTLPESVYSLYNLQTLLLGSWFTEFPKGFCSLINLQHFSVEGIGHFKKMPHEIGNTNSEKKGKEVEEN